MKIAIPGVALLIGLAAGFSAGMFWAQRSASSTVADVVADSLNSQEVELDGADPDSTEVALADNEAASVERIDAPAGDTTTGVPTGSVTETGGTPGLQPEEVEEVADLEDPAVAQESYQKMAQIFSVMDAGQAAAVLIQLDDAEIEGILRVMQGRAVAPILEEMDPARVASISRQVLGPGGSR